MAKIRCPKCGAIHETLKPGLSGILFARCSCGYFLPTITITGRSRLDSLCPRCQSELTATNAKQFTIQLIGGNSSGKTAYLAAFQHTYFKYSKYSPRITLNGKPTKAFNELEQIFSEGTTVPSSQSEAQAYNFIHKKNGLAQDNLLIYDIPDEVILSGAYEQNPINFGYTNGIVLLIDPLCIKTIRKRIAYEIGENALKGYSEDDPEDLIVQFINCFSRIIGRSAQSMNNIPVAVIITKADMEEVNRYVGIQKIKSTFSNDPTLYGDKLENARNSVCRQYLSSNGLSNVLNNLESVFSNVNYFSISSIGHIAQSDIPFVPWGIVEPILWIAKVERSRLYNRILQALKYMGADPFQNEESDGVIDFQYNSAIQMMNDGSYEAAIKEFSRLGNYRDAIFVLGGIPD